MIVHDVDPATGQAIVQGSLPWLDLRLGIPTASEFDKIITPKGVLADSARGYMARLLAERVTGLVMMDLPTLEWVERGTLLEAEAAAKFEFAYHTKLRRVAFITTDDGRWGASPDRLAEDGTMIEIKCPKDNTQMLYWMDGFGPRYKVQVQGQMLVGESERAVRFSYHPKLPWRKQDTPRDEPFIGSMRYLLARFSDELDAHTEKLKAEGYVQERMHAVGAVDAAYADPDDLERTIKSYGDYGTIFAG